MDENGTREPAQKLVLSATESNALDALFAKTREYLRKPALDTDQVSLETIDYLRKYKIC